MAGNDTNVEPPNAPNMSSEWQVTGNNTTNTSIGMITIGNPTVEISSCSSASMVDSFCPPIWDQPINGHSLGYCDMNVQNDASTSSPVRAGTVWTPNAVLRENMFMPMLPNSLPHFPADSGFIERAARFSCFSGGNFSQMVNPFGTHPHLGLMQQPNEALIGNVSKRVEVSKEGSLIGEHGTEGSPFKNEKKNEIFNDDAKNGVDLSGTQSDEAEFSGRGGQEESSGKGIGLKKRKRTEQKTVHNENNEAPQPPVEAAKDANEIRQKGDQHPSDPPKEEYLHVRARRGQATNSHSLAERIRREKISERMKFLQDLVPGCSKVTGKAVMLDEIINYVQSLQRQVEFLSMKLATVNPRLDFNMEGFLAKDILQTRAGLSSSLAFPPDITMPFPPLHPPQPGLIQAGLPRLGNSSETLQSPIGLQSALCGGFREPTSQAASVWDDELHNVVHNGFNLSAPLNSPDLSVSLPGHTKAEPHSDVEVEGLYPGIVCNVR
ncbi:hypothetical protein DH2020_049861 [Rehmannia glutinosa]|uniref:BHLH domain-containing protein n=1 Tax=Rehmannia glutinosa TaxID=99300 RepID=A0ABR0U237_REHGL